MVLNAIVNVLVECLVNSNQRWSQSILTSWILKTVTIVVGLLVTSVYNRSPWRLVGCCCCCWSYLLRVLTVRQRLGLTGPVTMEGCEVSWTECWPINSDNFKSIKRCWTISSKYSNSWTVLVMVSPYFLYFSPGFWLSHLWSDAAIIHRAVQKVDTRFYFMR